MEIIVITAMTTDRVIGKDGKIPWHHPEDLRHFKETTMGHALVMGRKTCESIGRALPGRRIVMISRRRISPVPGCETAGSLEAALVLLENEEKVFIAGGGEVYEQALDLADAVILTVIDRQYAGDTFFPELPEGRFCLHEERRLAGVAGCTVRIFRR